MKTGAAKFYTVDPWLKPFTEIIDERISKCHQKERQLAGSGTLSGFAMGHFYYGLHRDKDNWIFREHAPNATDIFLKGTFTGWKEKPEFRMTRINQHGDWEIIFPIQAMNHGDLYKLSVHWHGGKGERIPSYANRVVQDDRTKIFSAQVWIPEKSYKWQIETFVSEATTPVIYEAHVGMATPLEKTGTYREFTDNIIPIIARAGYNTIQLMAVQEHPLYGSFGYHVANFFAASSRFGTPEELKELIDNAHKAGLRVIMDLVHSHSVKNVNEGLGLFDGSPGQYFHTGNRRNHIAWDSLCFDYGKDSVIHFLLSNCRYWLEEYKFDGFRFDGITSMIYYDHGLGKNFTSYGEYFDAGQDVDALVYLYLANKMIHEFRPHSITVAEEMSGMPGLAAETSKRGYGFDYRLSMGVPDFWIKLIKETMDENWDMGHLMHELTQHRPEEKIISYCESHDQALVGDKTLIFRMIDAEMYTGMTKSHHSFNIDRGIALHKMIRLLTFSTAGGGYLNFMGNEFGHPEWIDFPREGNNWSYKYALRQWQLLENNDLKYQFLARFDRQMTALQHNYRILDDLYIGRLTENSNDKIIAFTRGDLLFVFNFNPTRSFTDYGIPVKGKFSMIIDSDNPEFGGFDRIDRRSVYTSVRKAERTTLNVPFQLYLYLPSRTAIVFKREAIRKATDI
ncbi:MAG: alpha amylase C-terminal domain-containing protein [Bacteroidales bacterium]|jgi:1,4-alpha-glucan branching enzyme|nr:alpha amylase C-terminal domain-containing protein [Bacteroidales bacterium]